MSGFADLVRPGTHVAVGDGAGLPTELLSALSSHARDIGGVRLLLGWCPTPIDGLDLTAYADIATVMGGYALRRPIDAGQVRYLPVRLGAAPALVRDVLRPDVLVAAVVRDADGHRFSTEASWMRAAVEAGARVVAVERSGPHCAAGPPLPPDRVHVVASSGAAPSSYVWSTPTDTHRQIAEHVASLVPDGARVQVGPGALGIAVLDALTRPVHIDTAVLTEAVVGLSMRGLLLGRPLATYAVGNVTLYDWIDGLPVIDRLEHTHDPGRLGSDPPLVAINTALQIDVLGQVNVESIDGSAVAGVGGQPDYAAAATTSPGGISIIAAPTRHGGRSTLVESLDAAVTTPSHDVGIVVTENGVADLRGLDRRERRRALEQLWA